jgi:hypothetical protein
MTMPNLLFWPDWSYAQIIFLAGLLQILSLIMIFNYDYLRTYLKLEQIFVSIWKKTILRAKLLGFEVLFNHFVSFNIGIKRI